MFIEIDRKIINTENIEQMEFIEGNDEFTKCKLYIEYRSGRSYYYPMNKEKYIQIIRKFEIV